MLNPHNPKTWWYRSKRLILACLLIVSCFTLTPFLVGGEEGKKEEGKKAAEDGKKEIKKEDKKEDKTTEEKDPGELPKNVQTPVRVGVTFMLNSIRNLDEKGGVFEAEVDLTLTWTNPDEAFPQKKHGSNVKSLSGKEAESKLKTMWVPAITIANLEKVTSTTPVLKIHSDGTVNYVQRIKANFKMHPDLRAFPFDYQYLTFFLDADKNTTGEIKFVQGLSEVNHSGIRPGVALSGWSLEQVIYKNSLVRGTAGTFYPRFEIQIELQRISTIHLLAFAPLLLLMLSPTITTLYTETKLSARLTMWGGSLLTLIATSFALNSKYPQLEADSILPVIINIVMIYQFVMIFISMTIVEPSFEKKFKNPYIIPELLLFAQWAVPVLYVLLMLYNILLVNTQS